MISNPIVKVSHSFSFKNLLREDYLSKKIFLKIKNQEFDEEILVYSPNKPIFAFPNEVKDIIDVYYQSYHELMGETLKPYDQMNFNDVAFGVACGLRIYFQYAPAFLYLRSKYNYHFTKGEWMKPYGWHPGEIKYSEKFKFIYDVGKDQYGKNWYMYDEYFFPEEVYQILNFEMKVLKKYPVEVEYDYIEHDAWVFSADEELIE